MQPNHFKGNDCNHLKAVVAGCSIIVSVIAVVAIKAGALPGMNNYRTAAGGSRLLRGVVAEDGDRRWLYGAQGRAALWRISSMALDSRPSASWSAWVISAVMSR